MSIRSNRSIDMGAYMSEWLNLKEACEILGLSKNTVKKLVEDGTLPGYQIKGVRGPRFKREDLEKMIEPIVPTKQKQASPPLKKRRS
jgi:excisionase family DNA binding protein